MGVKFTEEYQKWKNTQGREKKKQKPNKTAAQFSKAAEHGKDIQWVN